MKVFVGCDMEGATGVAHREHLVPGGDDFQAARRWYTADVAAVVEGCVEAGAEEVWVNDGHGWMRNLLLEGLPPASRLVVGPAKSVNKPLIQVTGIERGGFDCCLLVGFHSRAGTPGGLLAHTWVGMLVHEIRIQGQAAGEILLNAAIVGHFDVPLVFVSGADDAIREARADLGNRIETVEVKQTLGPTACATLVPERTGPMLRKGARRAVERRHEIAPWKTEGPVTIEVAFHRREMAAAALLTREGQQGKDDRTVAYVADNVPDTVRQVWRGLEMALKDDAAFLK